MRMTPPVRSCALPGGRDTRGRRPCAPDRRALLGAGLLAAAALPGAASAQAYPSKTVSIIVPFGGGNAYDLMVRYLADRHERTILKLRFVLSPFSFVFLLTGEEQFHIVLETLDTEEATYIWHIPKDKNTLREALKRIDNDLNIIRQHGRQYFLETQPADFTRVVHDYSEGRKGFVVWKDLVEERLL
jgi:hypothetical protein